MNTGNPGEKDFKPNALTSSEKILELKKYVDEQIKYLSGVIDTEIGHARTRSRILEASEDKKRDFENLTKRLKELFLARVLQISEMIQKDAGFLTSEEMRENLIHFVVEQELTACMQTLNIWFAEKK